MQIGLTLAPTVKTRLLALRLPSYSDACICHFSLLSYYSVFVLKSHGLDFIFKSLEVLSRYLAGVQPIAKMIATNGFPEGWRVRAEQIANWIP
ncbi:MULTISPECIES: hypothetical protein [Gracilibacillus]|uniref:hypothetical protein n=1 Tax=Gracilibacillus TaxID=74385 RepID=UPI000A41F561|nr:hypothetical protein [Gracilibacillus dipsosauri]